jgi:hypothetical protein
MHLGILRELSGSSRFLDLDPNNIANVNILKVTQQLLYMVLLVEMG